MHDMNPPRIFHLLLTLSIFLSVSSFFSSGPTTCELSTRVKAYNDVSLDETFDVSSLNSLSRREVFRQTSEATSLFFTASSFAVVALGSKPSPVQAYTPDSNPLRESLYLLSRVQEATVQQERFIKKAKSKELAQDFVQRKMKLSLRLVERSYRILDQITFCSTYLAPEYLVEATEAGNEAAEELQGAIDFVNDGLSGKGTLVTQEQVDVLTEAFTTTREKLFIFLDFMPKDTLDEARKRVEEENAKNIEEFDGDEDAGVYNPVVLPWKNRTVQ